MGLVLKGLQSLKGSPCAWGARNCCLTQPCPCLLPVQLVARQASLSTVNWDPSSLKGLKEHDNAFFRSRAALLSEVRALPTLLRLAPLCLGRGVPAGFKTCLQG